MINLVLSMVLHRWCERRGSSPWCCLRGRRDFRRLERETKNNKNKQLSPKRTHTSTTGKLVPALDGSQRLWVNVCRRISGQKGLRFGGGGAFSDIITDSGAGAHSRAHSRAPLRARASLMQAVQCCALATSGHTPKTWIKPFSQSA